MRCLCGQPATVLTRHGRYCGRCWLAVAPSRDGTRQLAPRPSIPCAALVCDQRALPTTDRCADHDPAVQYLEDRSQQILQFASETTTRRAA